MKALTSSCSTAIAERLASSSPRVSVHVSDRPEFCFNLHSRNDKKGCNFWFLKLVQSKGIYPVHAIPSETQVELETVESDLETAEPQAQQSEQKNESKFVRVSFQLQKNCNFGEQFLIVGDDPLLGSWDPSEALPMTWSDGHIWTDELDMPAEKSIQFKFILKGKAGNIIWQPGSDRIIHIWETMNRIIVCEDWENAGLQKVIEENQPVQSNEEAQVNSEMTLVAENLDIPEEEVVSNVSEIQGIQDRQTHSEEKSLAEPGLQQTTGYSISSSVEKPVAIVAQNIGSLEDLHNSTSSKDKIDWSEESADSAKNDDIIHGHSGTRAPLKNQERTVVVGNLFDFEGGPVLVPGLTPPVEPTEEAGSDEVQETTTIDTSIEAFESQDHNIPEFSMEQESDDDTPQEINVTINNGPEVPHNQHEEQSHLAPAMEERSNSELVDGNFMQNDIKWGRETVKKFLGKLGLL